VCVKTPLFCQGVRYLVKNAFVSAYTRLGHAGGWDAPLPRFASIRHGGESRPLHIALAFRSRDRVEGFKLTRQSSSDSYGEHLTKWVGQGSKQFDSGSLASAVNDEFEEN